MYPTPDPWGFWNPWQSLATEVGAQANKWKSWQNLMNQTKHPHSTHTNNHNAELLPLLLIRLNKHEVALTGVWALASRSADASLEQCPTLLNHSTIVTVLFLIKYTEVYIWWLSATKFRVPTRNVSSIKYQLDMLQVKGISWKFCKYQLEILQVSTRDVASIN